MSTLQRKGHITRMHESFQTRITCPLPSHLQLPPGVSSYIPGKQVHAYLRMAHAVLQLSVGKLTGDGGGGAGGL